MTRPRIAVLVSGGLDSAVLLVELARSEPVVPVYIAQGLAWEAEERAALAAFLEALDEPDIGGLVELEMPVAEAYAAHWSIGGGGVPDAETPDEAVYLPGRNLMLLSKLAIWCSERGMDRIAMAPLAGNPFADNSDRFFNTFEELTELALGSRIRILRPYAALEKAAVIQRGEDLPLALTLSCMAPEGGVACGVCNKCAERRRGYREAGVEDPTAYRDEPS